jgi:NAD(P)-dependent dehydrogenase (short-subunit alcohol dehydrogenase family)
MPTILITGAGRGIGLELTRAYLARGNRVLATHRPGPEAPRALVELAEANKGRIRLVPIDLANASALANLSSRLAERIDVLINSAGVVIDVGPLGTDGSMFQRMWRTNTVSPLMVARAALSNMTRGSKFATVSAVLGYTSSAGDDGRSHPDVRASVDDLVKGLASDLKPRGIAVAIIEPAPPEPGSDQARIDYMAIEAAAGIVDVIDQLDLDKSGEVFSLRSVGRELRKFR